MYIIVIIVCTPLILIAVYKLCYTIKQLRKEK